jgi:hypothetical protein
MRQGAKPSLKKGQFPWRIEQSSRWPQRPCSALRAFPATLSPSAAVSVVAARAFMVVPFIAVVRGAAA